MDGTTDDDIFSVLDHAGPDIVLTSSRAEDDFMDVLRDHSGSTKHY